MGVFMILRLFVAGLCLFWSALSFAVKPEIYSHWNKGALKGVDVVAYHELEPGEKAVKGKKEFAYEWKGAMWYFANEENLKKFKASPTFYEPAYGGYCAFSVAKNFTIAPRPDNWKIVDGKLYLNNNKKSFNLWQNKEAEMIEKGDENWPSVLAK